ncbi:MAG: glycosyltransferase [Rhodocyclaceae bacterium]
MHEPGVGTRQVRVCFVITGLGIGGAEHALLRLLSRFDRTRVVPTLIVLGREAALVDAFRAIDIEPLMLGLRPGRWPVGEIGRFLASVRAAQPDLIQGWMYHGNLAASFAAARLGLPACWSVRDTPDAAHAHSLFTRAVIRASGWYARRTARIFNVSARSADYCAAHLGWPRARLEVLPNGIDADEFRPDVARRAEARAAWGVRDDQPVIGMVARWAPVKNHALFIAAGRLFVAAHPDAVLVLAGKGLAPGNAELATLIAAAGLDGHLRLLGPRSDVAALYPGFDVATLSSRSEGFPNVLAEAMACGVPVVSTDVGDARDIVGGGGLIVEATPEAMSAGWQQAWAARHTHATVARARILERYALDTVAAGLQARYIALAGGGGVGPGSGIIRG